MTPEQFQLFLKDNERITGVAIEKYVNGGLREMDRKLTRHILEEELFKDRLLPAVEAYEDTIKNGKRILFGSGFVVSLGGAWLVIRQIFNF